MESFRIKFINKWLVIILLVSLALYFVSKGIQGIYDLPGIIFSAGLSVLLAIFFINFFLEKKWDPIRERVYNEIRFELWSIFSHVDLLTSPPDSIGIQTTDDKRSQYTFEKDKFYTLLKTKINLTHERVDALVNPKTNWGDMFKDSNSRLRDTEMKYIHLLDPSVVDQLKNVQKKLYYISLLIQMLHTARTPGITEYPTIITSPLNDDLNELLNLLKVFDDNIDFFQTLNQK